ncbi:MAG: FG-GAP-like repeat-containing protein [Candidatus Eiseniibacteriota bacterium]
MLAFSPDLVPLAGLVVAGLVLAGLAPARLSLAATRSAVLDSAAARATDLPFTDVTTAVVADTSIGRGVSWPDVDDDGDPDLYIVNTGTPNRLLRNDGHDDVGAPMFVDITAGPLAASGAGQGATWADYDDDGDVDVYLTSWGPNALLRNDGVAGGFVDATHDGLGDDGLGTGAAWSDLDLDGDLDLYVANQGQPNHLFRNDGDGRFVDVTTPPLGHAGLGRGVATTDFDLDGDVDLYLVNLSANLLIVNEGDGTFTSVAAAPLGDPGPGRGAAWGDFDRDGDPDLYLTNDGATNRLLVSQEAGAAFADVTSPALADAGFGVDVAWVDVDLDGWLDLYWTNAPGPNRLLRGDGAGGFVEATAPPLDAPEQTFCAAWADLDADGDRDVYLSRLDGANRLLRNDGAGPAEHHWLQVDLRGTDSNRSAIGARLRVVAADGPPAGSHRATPSVMGRAARSAPRSTTRAFALDGGAGYLSQDERLLAIGLGPAARVDSLIVDWPSGRRQVLTALDVDRRLEIVEPRSWQPVDIDVAAPPGGHAGRGAGLVDAEGDGDLDLYLAADGVANRLLVNVGTATGPRFAAATPAPLADPGAGRGVAWGDVDADGDLDLAVANHGEANRLFRNDGALAFADVTAGPLAASERTATLAWTDYDLDGDLDLHVVNDGETDRLLRNDGMDAAGVPRLVDPDPGGGASAPEALIADPGNGRAATWADLDLDGDSDLYLVTAGSVNRLFRNDRGGYFHETTASPIDDDGDCRAAAVLDADADGDLDLALARGDAPDRLFRATPFGFIELPDEPLGRAGPTRDLVTLDADLDADPDLYAVLDGAANRLLRNDGYGGAAFAVVHSVAVADQGDGQAAIAADLDADGDLDLVLINGTTPARLLRNDGDWTRTRDHHWLALDLVARDAAPRGLGATARLVMDGQARLGVAGGARGGRAHGPATVHVGVGSATRVDTLEVLWPNRRLDRRRGVAVDQRLVVDEPPGAWSEIGAASGVADPGPARGVVWADLDRDGDPDLAVTRDGVGGRLYRNDGAGGGGGAAAGADGGAARGASGSTAGGTAGGAAGTLRFTGLPAGPFGTPLAARGAVAGDMDGDGDLDLYVAVDGPNRLLANGGDATFTDVTDALLAGDAPSTAVTWLDIDRDGDLDLHVANDGVADRLLRNDGASGGFHDVTPPLLADTGAARHAAWSDLDLDGDLDLFLCNAPGTNRLLRNDTPAGAAAPVFADRTTPLLAGTGHTQAAAAGDLDGDLDIDLYLIHDGTPNLLLRNDGRDGFVDLLELELEDRRPASGAALADVDLDGDLDLYLSGRAGGDRLWRNDGPPRRFVDRTTGPLLVAGRTGAAAWGDADGDGDLDLVAVQDGLPDRLLRNDQTTGHGWLAIDLVGAVSNRDGVGAQVRVVAQGRTQLREVPAPATPRAQSAAGVLLGLRVASVVDTLQVRWPGGVLQQRLTVAIDQRLVLAEATALTDIVPPAAGVADAFQPFELTTRARVLAFERPAFFGRRAGDDDPRFRGLGMQSEGPLLTVEVPASLATESGIEYYFEIDVDGRRYRQPAIPADSLYFLPVFSETLTQRPTPAPLEYVLLGVPFHPDETDPVHALGAELGPYDPSRWRLGHYDPRGDVYREPPETGDLEPGRGFWLIQREPRPLVLAGRSASSVTGVTIDLEPGWNQIGHPFLFPVSWDDVDRSAAPDVEPRLVGYTAGGYVDRGLLEPWQGYWLRNGGTTVETIRVPGRRATGDPRAGGASAPEPGAAVRDGDLGWALRIVTTAGATRDGPDLAGVARGAADGLDVHDAHQPPALPAHVATWLERDGGAAGGVHRLCRDILPGGQLDAGRVWQLVVRVPGRTFVGAAAGGGRPPADAIAAVPATVTIDGLDGDAGVPVDLGVWLVDPDGYGMRDLRREPPLFEVAAGEERRQLLVVGSEVARDRLIATLVSPALPLRVEPASPNPFHPATTIRFAMREPARVVLRIYDVRGRHVRTLLDAPLAAGRHAVQWHGVDARGRPAPSGVYYYRAAIGGHVVTRSMVLVR